MRSRLIKALNNRFYVKFMQLDIGLFDQESKIKVGTIQQNMSILELRRNDSHTDDAKY